MESECWWGGAWERGYATMHLASFPGFPAPEHKYVGRTGYIVSYEYEIIGKGAEFSEQKGDILYALFIQLYIQGSL